MNIRGLTPQVLIAGQAVQFELRPRDALAWIAVDKLNAHQISCWLSECPEALLWSLAQHVGKGPFDWSDLIRWPGIRTCESATATVVRLDALQRKHFHKTLQNAGSAADTKPTQSKLLDLVVNTCQLDGAAVNSWLESLDLPRDFWSQLAAAAQSESGLFAIELSFAGDHREPADREFEKRLHLEKMASMKQLAYGASHEINNPLANIASRAQTLLMDETDPDRRLRLSKINEQAFRAHEMIADMMLFAHPPRPKFTQVNPVQLVQNVIEEIQPLARQQQTEIRLRAAEVPATHLDKTHLAVAVKALLQNGLESLQQSGTIQIHVSHTEALPLPVLEITITDDGPGITAEAARHIFDPFYSGREAGRGLGFGLSKVWRIAELHDGEISAESPDHGGARFCLRIPYRDAA